MKTMNYYYLINSNKNVFQTYLGSVESNISIKYRLFETGLGCLRLMWVFLYLNDILAVKIKM